MSIKSTRNTEKKNVADFALWKAAKKYEISFESPWGLGRIAWHIECSTMITHLFGNHIHIHSGGIDLKFPHHHNELLQSVAWSKDPNWVDYFLHSGHINVANSKMAQSLNNFVTIQEYLKTGSIRELRLLFATHQWDRVLDFGENVMNDVYSLDKRIDAFIKHVSYLNKINKPQKQSNSLSKEDLNYLNRLVEHKKQISDHLENNFNSLKVFSVIQSMINDTYEYLSFPNINYNFLNKYKDHILNILSLFDLEYEQPSNGDNEKEKEKNVLIETIIDIRSKIRDMTKSTSAKNDLYKLSDEIRDKIMPALGVELADQKDNPTKWSYL